MPRARCFQLATQKVLAIVVSFLLAFLLCLWPGFVPEECIQFKAWFLCWFEPFRTYAVKMFSCLLIDGGRSPKTLKKEEHGYVEVDPEMFAKYKRELQEQGSVEIKTA
jgi:hypothetical protein